MPVCCNEDCDGGVNGCLLMFCLSKCQPSCLSSCSGTAASPLQPDVLSPVSVKSVERALPQCSGHPEPSPHQATIASKLHAHPPTISPMLTVTVSGSSSIIDAFVLSTAACSQDAVAKGALTEFLKTFLKVLPQIR